MASSFQLRKEHAWSLVHTSFPAEIPQPPSSGQVKSPPTLGGPGSGPTPSDPVGRLPPQAMLFGKKFQYDLVSPLDSPSRNGKTNLKVRLKKIQSHRWRAVTHRLQGCERGPEGSFWDRSGISGRGSTRPADEMDST